MVIDEESLVMMDNIENNIWETVDDVFFFFVCK